MADNHDQTAPRLCIDCAHFRRNSVVPDDLAMGRCAKMIDPVTGQPNAYCSSMRMGKEHIDPKHCGPEGKLWEKRVGDLAPLPARRKWQWWA